MGRIPASIIDNLREQRSKGKSLTELSIVFNLPKSSVLRHVKDVEIQEGYKSEWELKRKSSVARKAMFEKIASDKARTLISSSNDKEKVLFLAALYWAEGHKNDLSFTNSDPKMVRFFVKCLVTILNIKPERIRMSIRVYEDMNIDDCKSFWAETAGFKLNVYSVNILVGKKKGKLKYGMCRIRVIKAHELLKYLFAVKDRMIEIG